MTRQPSTTVSTRAGRWRSYVLQTTILATVPSVLAFGAYRLGVKHGADVGGATPATTGYENRVCYIGDLVTEQTDEVDVQTRVYADYDALLEVIIDTLGHDLWDCYGGDGSLQGFVRGRSIVVYQTPPNHEKVANLLARLRKASWQASGSEPVEPSAHDGDGEP